MEDKIFPSPKALYETQESYQALLAAMATLPVEQRRAVHLHYLDGLTLRETSTRAGVSVGAVKVRLHRARVKLSATLAGEGRRRQTTDTFEMIIKERSMKAQGKSMPLFLMRDIVVFPFMTVPLFLGRAKSIKLLRRQWPMMAESFLLPKGTQRQVNLRVRTYFQSGLSLRL